MERLPRRRSREWCVDLLLAFLPVLNPVLAGFRGAGYYVSRCRISTFRSAMLPETQLYTALSMVRSNAPGLHTSHRGAGQPVGTQLIWLQAAVSSQL